MGWTLSFYVIISHMKRYLQKLVSEVLGGMFENGQISALPQFEISALPPAKQKFGDYSINVAHAIAREGKFNANDVAGIIAQKLKENDDQAMLGEVNVANGFVNIFASPKALQKNAQNCASDKIEIEQIGSSGGRTRKIVFEYSSPNTNKPLHIGHTRNDVYGMACINLLRAAGFEVTAAEIINNRGIHIMKSMLMYMKYGKGATPQSTGTKGDHFVGKFYAMFDQENLKFAKKVGESSLGGELRHDVPPRNHDVPPDKPLSQYDALRGGSHAAPPDKSQSHGEASPEQSFIEQTPLEKEALNLLQKWEAGDAQTRALWKKMNAWFYEGLKETYAREGSQFDDVEYESEIFDKGKDLVLDGVKKGIFQREPDGSVSVDLSSQGLDKKYLLRAGGTTLYMTQDLYLWDLRNKKFKPDLALVTTGSEQAYHFAVLKNIFKLLEYPWADSFSHLPYEHVYLGNSKMSSRAGNTVSADDLLLNVKEKVRRTMQNSQKIKARAEDEDLVEDIAFAAIKYGYLKFDRNTKIYFDMDETIQVEGNTGPHIQYTYARIRSILDQAVATSATTVDTTSGATAGTTAGAKATATVDVIAKASATAAATTTGSRAPDFSALSAPEELSLLRFLLHWEEAVLQAALEYKPSLLCAYLFELSAKYNSFYEKHSVLKAESAELKTARLILSGIVANILANGLALLGIKAPAKM